MFLYLALVPLAGLAAWGLARIAGGSPALRASAAQPQPALEPAETGVPMGQAGGASGPVGALLQEGLKKVLPEAAGVVAAGVAATVAAVQVVKAAGGSELEQAATGANLTLAVPILTKEGVGALLGELGVESQPVKDAAGETVAVGLFAAPLLPLYAQLKAVQGLVAVLGGGEPEPFTPALEQLLTAGEQQSLKHNPTALLQVIQQRRRALKMAALMPGTHTVRIRVSTDEGDGPARFFVLVDGQVVTPELVAVAAHSSGMRQDHLVRVSLNHAQTIAVCFPNPAYSPSEGYRTLWVDALWIDGTYYQPSEGHYVREGLDPLPGQYALQWRGFLVWTLKPENRTTAAPVRTRYSAAQMVLADASSTFVPATSWPT